MNLNIWKMVYFQLKEIKYVHLHLHVRLVSDKNFKNGKWRTVRLHDKKLAGLDKGTLEFFVFLHLFIRLLFYSFFAVWGGPMPSWEYLVSNLQQ